MARRIRAALTRLYRMTFEAGAVRYDTFGSYPDQEEQ